MKQRRIFLVSDDVILNRLHQAEIPDSYHYDRAETLDLDMCEIVAVEWISEDHALRDGLSRRGISPTRISYVDVSADTDLRQACAKPKHFFWEDAVTLDELVYSPDDVKIYSSSIPFLDKDLRWGWRLPELGVVAGSYGSGKSTFGQFLAASFVNGAGRELGSGALLCSWEDIGWAVRENIARFETNLEPHHRDLQSKISFVRRGADKDRLVSWFMEIVEYYHVRYGTKFFWLDPWNEMDHVKDNRQSETEYVRDVMKAFRRLVDRLKIILIVATHVPAKITKGNGEIEPFKIAHAFGSSQFGNKADRGICILRAKKWDEANGHTIIRLDKAKLEGVMGIKKTIGLRFDPHKFLFEKDAFVTESVKELWKD